MTFVVVFGAGLSRKQHQAATSTGGETPYGWRGAVPPIGRGAALCDRGVVLAVFMAGW